MMYAIKFLLYLILPCIFLCCSPLKNYGWFGSNIPPFNFEAYQKKINSKTDITFLVAGDPQFDFREDKQIHLLASSAMKQVHKMIGRKQNGGLMQGVWTPRTYYNSNAFSFGVADKIESPLFLLFTGDLTMHGKRSEWELFRSVYEKTDLIVFPGLGNHDLDSNYSIQYIVKRLGSIRHPGFSFDAHSKNYSWDVGIFHFVQMHEYGGSTGAKEIEWLKKDFAKARQKNQKIILIQHYGLDDFSLCYDQPFGEPEEKYTLENCRWWKNKDINRLKNLIKDHNVVAMFTGHWHISGYCDWHLGDERIPVFTSGGAKDTYNFLLVRLTDEYINVGSIQFSGSWKKPILHLSRFWMREKQYNGNDTICQFVSRDPLSRRYGRYK